jgi:hypothetical protein
MGAWQRGSRWTVTLLVGWLVACSPEGSPIGPFDVPLVDGGPIRRARDAGVDGGMDAGRDVGPFGPAMWAPFADVPSTCPVEVALRPAEVGFALGWEPCGEGCAHWIGDRSLRWRDAGARRAWVSGEWLLHGFTMLLDLDAGPLFVLRVPLAIEGRALRCSLDGVSGPEDEVVVVASAIAGWTRLYRVTLGAATGIRTLLVRDDVGFDPDVLRRSETHVALRGTAGVVWLIDAEGVANVSSRASGVAVDLQLVGGDTFWIEQSEREVLAHAPPGMRGAVVYEPVERWLDSFSTDGVDFVWIEPRAGGTALERSEILGASFDGTQLMPRVIRELPPGSLGSRGVVGAGMFVLRERDAYGAWTYAVYRLSDGARAVFVPPTGRATDVVRVTSDEILVGSTDSVYALAPSTLRFE